MASPTAAEVHYCEVMALEHVETVTEPVETLTEPLETVQVIPQVG